MAELKRLYESADEVRKVVRDFEDCKILPSEFKHEAHLTVALWYLWRSTIIEATVRMRESLFRFLNHHGAAGGYHETITIFWLRVVGSFIDAAPAERSITEVANELAANYNNSRLIFEYYSKERLSSEEAKACWIEPDLQPLDL